MFQTERLSGEGRSIYIFDLSRLLRKKVVPVNGMRGEEEECGGGGGGGGGGMWCPGSAN